jgi:hypothetical protein
MVEQGREVPGLLEVAATTARTSAAGRWTRLGLGMA